MMDCCERVGSKRLMEVEYPCQYKRMRQTDGHSMEEIEYQMMEESQSHEINTNEVNLEMMDDYQLNTRETFLPEYEEILEKKAPHMEYSKDDSQSSSLNSRSQISGHFSMMQHPETIPSLHQYKTHSQPLRLVNSNCRMVASCWYCRRQESVVHCQSCDRLTCEANCLYCCDKCQVYVCNTCSMTDYSCRYERRLCIDCYYHLQH